MRRSSTRIRVENESNVGLEKVCRVESEGRVPNRTFELVIEMQIEFKRRWLLLVINRMSISRRIANVLIGRSFRSVAYRSININ